MQVTRLQDEAQTTFILYGSVVTTSYSTSTTYVYAEQQASFWGIPHTLMRVLLFKGLL